MAERKIDLGPRLDSLDYRVQSKNPRNKLFIENLLEGLEQYGITPDVSGKVTATRGRDETGRKTNINSSAAAKVNYDNLWYDLDAFYNYNQMFKRAQNTLGGEAAADLGLANVKIGGSRTQQDNSFYHNPSSTQFNAGVNVPVLGGVFGLGYKQINNAGNNGEQKQIDQLLNASYENTGVLGNNDVFGLYGSFNKGSSGKPETKVGVKYRIPLGGLF